MTMRFLWFAPCLGSAATLWAQTTQPIQPQTPDIKVPPPVTIAPPPGKDVLGGKPLSAQDAAKIALEHQRTLAVAKAAVKSASGARKSAAADLGPSVELSSAYTDVNQIKVDNATSLPLGTSNGYSSSITLHQLVFDFSHSADLVKQAADLEEAARQAYERTRQDLVLQVKQAYYGYVQKRSLTTSAEANVTNRQAQLELAQARLNSGIGAPADVVSAKTFLADAVSSLTDARQAEAQARIGLAILLGLDPRTNVVPSESTETAPEGDLELGALVDRALKDRPEVAQATAVLHAAQAGLKAARTGNAPGLFFNAGITGRGNDDPLRSELGTYGVTLSWTLFDSGFVAGHVEQAKAGVESAQAEMELTAQGVIADVAQAYVALKTAEQKAEVTSASLANAQEGVRLSEGRYRAGVTTFLEVTTAQTSLFTAETNDVNAKAAVQQARAALARAIGTKVD